MLVVLQRDPYGVARSVIEVDEVWRLVLFAYDGVWDESTEELPGWVAFDCAPTAIDEMGARVAVAVAFLPEDAQTLAVGDHGWKLTWS